MKNKVFGTVDFELNQMDSRSGTNLKMFEYMAAGIPVITTEFGARGIENTESLVVADKKDMAETINHLRLDHMEIKARKGREYVEQDYDWKNISILIKNKVQEYGL